jgi:hypothetical protein
MLWLVFARLRGWLTPKGRAIVSPTQSVGPVCQEHTTPTGKPCSVGTMCPLHRPANQAALQSSEAVQLTSVDQNSGSETQPVSATNQSKAVGTKRQTPVCQTRQPAKSAAKPKQKPAKQGSSGKKTTPAKASAQTRTVKRSGASGT